MKAVLRIKWLCILLVGYSFSNSVFGQNLYSFFVAGHTYGKPGVNNIGLHPPFVEKFGYINSRSEIAFGVFTGDIVSPNPTIQDWGEVDDDIETLGLPVYFAVGNHDMENRPVFENRYGDTYYSFIHENDFFIILDPNIDGWNISGEQLSFLENALLVNSGSIDNIYVFFHQLLWREDDNIYSTIKPNSTEGRYPEINFWTEVEPIFNSLSNEVYMFAGDLGAAAWSSDFMYDKYDNITLVASGMGEGPELGDNFVVVNVAEDKSVTYDLVCLNNDLNCLGELEDAQLTSSISNREERLSLNLYPNPVDNILVIDNKGTDVTFTLFEIRDVAGRVCAFGKLKKGNKHVDIKKIPNGLYFIYLFADEYTPFIEEIVIRH